MLRARLLGSIPSILALSLLCATHAPAQGIPPAGAKAEEPADGAPAGLFSDPHGKLIRGEELSAEVVAGADRVRVSATLVPTPEIAAFAAWEDLGARHENRVRIAALIAEVEARLPAAEIVVLRRFENQPSLYLEATVAGIELLLADPGIASVAPTIAMRPHTRQGIPLIAGMRPRWATGGGQGVAIAVCDTGVDYTHPDLGGGGFPNAKVIGGYDVADNDPDPLPANFPEGIHGTACAGIAAGSVPAATATDAIDYIGGIAYGAKVYALKITPGFSGTAFDPEIAAAWDWCVTHQFDDPSAPILVINTSFGSLLGYSGNCDLVSPVLTTAGQFAVAAGIAVVVSSGNEGRCSAIASPSCLSMVIAVGAVYDNAIHSSGYCVEPPDPGCPSIPAGCASSTGFRCEDNVVAAGTVTCYSNSSAELDILGPSDTAHTLDIRGLGGVSLGDYTNTFNGTSAAAPYIAGSIAVLQSAAGQLLGTFLTPAQALAALQSTGTPVVDPKSGVVTSLPDIEKALATFAPRWGISDPLTDLTFNAAAMLFVDGDTGGNFPFAYDEDTQAALSFFPLGSSWIGRIPACYANDNPPPAQFTHADSIQRATITGLGTPFLTLEWRSHVFVRTLEDGYVATAVGNLLAAINAEILPSASAPPGSPVSLTYLWDNHTFNNVQPEVVNEDVGNVDASLSVDGNDLFGGSFDIPTFSAPFSTASLTQKDQIGGFPGYVVGDTVSVSFDTSSNAAIAMLGNPTGAPPLFKDTLDAGCRGSITLSLLGPPIAPPPVPPVPPVHFRGGFSVDLGGDSLFSDLTPDGIDTFDPGDIYPWNGPPLPPAGADGSIDDAAFIGGPGDPPPDPPFGLPAMPPVCVIAPLLPTAFDLNAADLVDVPFATILPLGALGPIPRFPSACIPSADHLLISFDEDGALPYAGGPHCDVPLSAPAPDGSELRGDEVLVVELAPGIPGAVLDVRPLAHERKVHPNLAPPPDPTVDFNDDVDVLALVPYDAQCGFLHFTVDHEAAGATGYVPGIIYEFDIANGSVSAIVDPQFQIGLPVGTEIDSIAWTFQQNLTPVAGSIYSALDGLLLFFSVDSDDPLSPGIDESGGLSPDTIYASYLDGTHFVHLPNLTGGGTFGADIDAIDAVAGDVRDADYQFRLRSNQLVIGYDPTVGTGGSNITITIDEDPDAAGYPNDTTGFSLTLAHDPLYLLGTGVTLAGPVAALVASSAGFFAPQVLPDGVAVSVIYDPVGGSTLAFPQPAPAVTIAYQINPGTFLGNPFGATSALRYTNVLPGGVPNRVTLASGVDVLPWVEDVPVHIIPGFGVCFRRGDCNDSGGVDIADAIAQLGILFTGLPMTLCPAACDSNGSAPFDIADPIYLLGFLFAGGPAPPPPYPACAVVPGANCTLFTSCPLPCP